jgi:short-subunit dehydrogenase
MQRVLIIGATGGIGGELFRQMADSEDYEVVGWSSLDLDLDYPERIFDCDFSDIDILINCAGHNQGSYQGFMKNSWQNQYSQIKVNYISNLFLLKHYAHQRSQGKYVWLSSISMDNPRVFHSIYTGTKVASKFTIDLITQEITHVNVLEARVGLVKSKVRYRNFEGTKTMQEVQDSYANESWAMDCDHVAKHLLLAIEQNLTYTTII